MVMWKKKLYLRISENKFSSGTFFIKLIAIFELLSFFFEILSLITLFSTHLDIFSWNQKKKKTHVICTMDWQILDFFHSSSSKSKMLCLWFHWDTGLDQCWTKMFRNILAKSEKKSQQKRINEPSFINLSNFFCYETYFFGGKGDNGLSCSPEVTWSNKEIRNASLNWNAVENWVIHCQTQSINCINIGDLSLDRKPSEDIPQRSANLCPKDSHSYSKIII